MKMMKWFKGLRYIRVQIIIYYLVTSILLVTFMSTILYMSLSAILMDGELSNTTESVEKSGQSIQLYIEKLKALSNILARDPNTIDYLKTNDPQIRQSVAALLDNVLQSDTMLLTGILVSKSGSILSNDSHLDMQVSKDMMNESWYVDAVKGDAMPVLTSIRRQDFTMDKNTWVISIGQEITDLNGEHLGLMILDFSYEVIDNLLSNLSLGKQGFAFILDQKGALVYHMDPTYFEDSSKKEVLINIDKMSDGYDTHMKRLIHHYTVTGTEWILVGVSTLDHLTAARRQIIETLFIIIVLLFSISMVIGFIIANRITKPILSLENTMRAVSDQVVFADEIPNSSYEIDRLRIHFNEMNQKIFDMMESIKVREKYLREVELKSLFSQINPHFLYNTLDTIIWMAEFKDTEKVVAITKSLAQFFRLSLSKGSQMIPLHQEIDHVAQYLYIQEQRYGDHLTYAFDIDPTLNDILVPKIILQPIVENAIYHGIKLLPYPGKITISAKQYKDKDMLITISDNGVGYSPNRTKTTSETTTKLGGVGLENVNNRLKLIYGDAYGLTIESEIGKGTIIKLFLTQ
ncbi:sensor histidine kinase [Fusibacter bizertensis]|uniref:Sensor histidine kinase n=1 Tax=Fusibacter bizertensis TaxID=1488331 RepID=A0ABT6NBU1_9FIRM|nr:sensor histidine kinase [Fusibacter bizertensis]MDH8677845.1 sensor histidine kinase [Fusibacter bizertensis]